jgi:hypothetical protein
MDPESATRAPDGHDNSGTALPQRNVEQQYRAADAFSRRDLGAFLAICDPDTPLRSKTCASAET